MTIHLYHDTRFFVEPWISGRRKQRSKGLTGKWTDPLPTLPIHALDKLWYLQPSIYAAKACVHATDGSESGAENEAVHGTSDYWEFICDLLSWSKLQCYYTTLCILQDQKM